MSRLLVAATTLLVAVPLSLAAAPARALEDGDHSGTSAQSAKQADDLVGASDDSADADHVLVKFAAGTSGAQQMAVVDAADAALDGDVGSTGYVQLAVGDHDPVEVAAELAASAGVDDAQVDHVRTTSQWPSDPLVPWSATYFDLIRLPRAWDESVGDGVVVAVLGTGVEATHEDLVGGVLPGIDLVDHDDDADDPAGSGTVMAGIIAASADNGVGSAGVAPQAMILPVRVVGPDGTSADSDVAEGIEWAVDHGADIVDLSMSGDEPSPVLLAAIKDAVAAGALVVAPAGGTATDAPAYPAAYAPEVAGLISVTATDNDGRLAPLSRWGDTVSLAAPGVSLYGPVPTWGYTTGDGSWYAAPVVAGVAALVLAREDLSPAELELRLERTANDVGRRGVDPFYGFGLIDAAAAVTASDDAPAAVAVPLGPWRSDGADDDTRMTARALTDAGATATLSPEGDVDWFRYTAAERGWYAVDVEVVDHWYNADRLDPVIEVRDASGGLLGRADRWGPSSDESVLVSAAAAGPLFVRVTNASGIAMDNHYRLTVTPTTGPAFETMAPRAHVGADNVRVGDVTGDGIPDVVSDGLWVFPGTGFGDVGAPTDLPRDMSLGYATNFDLADLDHDGDVDVVASMSLAGGPVVLLQDHGSFEVGSILGTPFGSPTIADMDGDGDPDLVLENNDSIAVWLNDGTGVFTRSSSTVSGWLGHVEAGDVTGDGRPDIVGGRSMLVQQPDGTFGAPVALPLSASVFMPDVRLGDVTGDGRIDVVRTDGDGVRVDPQLAGGGLGDGTHYAPGGASGPVAIGDMDLDGRLDVLLADGRGSRIWLLPQLPDGTLGAGMAIDAPFDSPLTNALQVSDLDGDGWPDIVLGHRDGPATFRQCRLDRRTPLRKGWVSSVSPGQGASGVATRPNLKVGFDGEVDPASVSPSTVSLIDGLTGAEVPSVPSYDAATRTISLVPSVDLSGGGHYQLRVSGVRYVDGRSMTETERSWFTVAAGGARYTPVDPMRVLDTRTGRGMTVAAHKIASGEVVKLDLRDLTAVGATAVVLNVTAASPTTFGNVRVYPYRAGSAPPRVSNVNVAPGVDQPNLVTVPIGDDGVVALLPESTSTHLIADVAGYYSAAGAAAFEQTAPRRLMDTRSGVGVRRGSLTGGSWVDLRVSGVGSVPRDALAVVLNVTATQVAQRSHVRVYPTPADSEDQTPPDISNLNLTPGRDQPNLVTVPVGDGGRVRFYLHQGRADLIADIAGYYSATGDNGFVPVAPTRVVDTRSGQGISTTLRKGTVSSVKIAGSGPVPAGAVAAVLNVTGVQPRGVTHVRAFPTTSAAPPDISTINLVPGRDEANLAVVPVGLGGAVSFYPATADVDLVVDVAGYFAR